MFMGHREAYVKPDIMNNDANLYDSSAVELPFHL